MAGSLDQLHVAVSGRYAIERELGRGATAIVYLAHDVKHNRQVAIKVLNPELALAVRAERFLREIQIAAQLNHPNILPVYDSGQAGEFLYYVMPVVGESLRDRLNREKQLSLEEALAIAREVADALGYAHKQGIIHRDIKPENILLHQGHAQVADFGIARALSAAGSQSLTDGIALGTPAYMSPEQGAASPQIDARADLYALGCVLYEMLAGHPPFTGTTAQEVLARHAMDAVPSLLAARKAVPPGVEHAIQRALAKQPADRFATLKGFADALAEDHGNEESRPRRRRAGIAVVAMVALAGWSYARFTRPPVIAVFPFASITTDSTDVYFSDGITEEIANALSRLPGVRVVPVRPEYLASRGGGVSPRDIAAGLHASRILEGSVRRLGGRLTVSARVVDVREGAQLWGETVRAEEADVFGVQERLLRSLVGGLGLNVGNTAGVLVHSPTANLVAYDLYLKGRYFFERRSAQDLKIAVDDFAVAIANDSNYALAYSGLSDSYVAAGFDGYMPRREAYDKAKTAAIRAVAVGPDLAETHTSLGRVRYNVEWDWVGTETEYRRAIALNPRYALAHSYYGFFLSNIRGDFGRALQEARQGVELDPVSTTTANIMALIEHHAGRYPDAIRDFRRAIALQPRYFALHRYLGESLIMSGRLEEARAQADTALQLQPGAVGPLGDLGTVYALSGNRAAALAILDTLERKTGGSSVGLIVLQAHLGNVEQAVSLFERATANAAGATLAPNHFQNPILTSLRGNQRYVAALKRIGVTPGWQ